MTKPTALPVESITTSDNLYKVYLAPVYYEKLVKEGELHQVLIKSNIIELGNNLIVQLMDYQEIKSNKCLVKVVKFSKLQVAKNQLFTSKISIKLIVNSELS